jgi:hypothetical protein
VSEDSALSPSVLESLRRIRGARPPMVERCEFCGSDLPEAHGHLVNVTARALLCVCRPCYLLFTHDGAGGQRFRAVPDRYRGCELDPAVCRALGMPVGFAFLFINSTLDRIVMQYPGPAGATEAEVPDEAWREVLASAPVLASLAPDVEALLIRRHDSGAVDAFVVPIDACYELSGRLRRSWRGFQGGEEAWREVDQFFARVSERAREAAYPERVER